MLHKFFLVGCLLSISVFLSSIIPPAIVLSGLPECDGFAGDAAVKVVNGVTHLSYRHHINDYNYSIIYVRISADNTVTHYTADTYAETNWELGKPPNLPTLEVDGATIYIFYQKDYHLFRAVSTNGGADFTVAYMDTKADAMPIVRKNNGNWNSFITPHDAVADSGYQYFSKTDESQNGTPVYYMGTDVIYGPVRTNSDIWIKQEGGGTNNGWPTFYGPVYTSGQIMSYSGTPPYAQVFRGGYMENVPQLNYDYQLTNTIIQAQGTQIWPVVFDSLRIMFITVNGSSYTSWVGNIVQTGVDTLWVHSSFPPGSGIPLYANIVPHVDTLWTLGPSGNCSNRINIVNSILWIKGRFQGKQIWYSPYDIMINDNIYLAGTQMGQAPDGSVPGSSINSSDYVSLVSDKKIIVQYGYRNPQDSTRYKPNCDGDGMGAVWIYASLYAMRQDPTYNPRQDGVFTFEYQHPHPSIPASLFQDVLYDNIDLHRRSYPPTPTNPWPPNIDYPYYNPLWPEGFPLLERGTIHLYGSIYQQRRGYVHRDLSDADYPNPAGVWDIDLDICGGPSGANYYDPVLGINFQGINAPNASGGGVGYKMDYHFDNRLAYDTYPFNPFGLGMRYKISADGNNWDIYYFKSLNEEVRNKNLFSKNGRTAMHLNNHIAWQAPPNQNIASYEVDFAPGDSLQSLIIAGDNNLLLNIYRDHQAGQDSVRIVRMYPTNNTLEEQISLPVMSKVNSLFNLADGRYCFGKLDEESRILFYASDPGGNPMLWSIWNPQIAELASLQFDADKSRLSILPANADTVYVLLKLVNAATNAQTLYYAKGTLELTHNQDFIEPELNFSTLVYPNPFKDRLTLKLETNKSVTASIAVYNSKGQKVRTIAANTLLSKGEHSLVWDGSDDLGRNASNGIYIIKSRLGDIEKLEKVLRIK